MATGGRLTALERGDSVARCVRDVVHMLVRGAYAELEERTGARRLRARDIEAGIAEYGRTLAMPPETAYDDLYVIPVRGTKPQAYFVAFRLYTREEGHSDLEIQLTLSEREDGEEMDVQIDGILVA